MDNDKTRSGSGEFFKRSGDLGPGERLSAHGHRPAPGDTFTWLERAEKFLYLIFGEVMGENTVFPHKRARFSLAAGAGPEIPC